MIKKFLSYFFGEEQKEPPEYKPWRRDLSILLSYVKSSYNIKLINDDSAYKARLLVKFYILGLFKYYAEKNNLTPGQYRYLFLSTAPKSGYDVDSFTVIFDSSDQFISFIPELEADKIIAIDTGFSVAKVFFEERSWSGREELGKLIESWGAKNYFPFETEEVTAYTWQIIQAQRKTPKSFFSRSIDYLISQPNKNIHLSHPKKDDKKSNVKVNKVRTYQLTISLKGWLASLPKGSKITKVTAPPKTYLNQIEHQEKRMDKITKVIYPTAQDWISRLPKDINIRIPPKGSIKSGSHKKMFYCVFSLGDSTKEWLSSLPKGSRITSIKFPPKK